MPDWSAVTSTRPHPAARLEDRLNALVGAWLGRRGWVPRVEPYTGYGSDGWVRVMARAVLAPPGTRAVEVAEKDSASGRRAVRGWRSFLTGKVPRATVRVQVGDAVHDVVADRGGYIDAVLPAELAPGWQRVVLSVGGDPVDAPVLVVPPGPNVAMVSDIDDTVMVTALPRPLLAAWNSFVLHEQARRAVPGMAELYRRWQGANPDAPTFYLSTGAWNVAPAVRRFLERHGYPVGPLLLTDWGPTNTGWFRSGRAHKLATLRRLIGELPGTRFVLVGDDGQHDPAIYAEIAAEHPDRVAFVAIRELSAAQQMLSHGAPGPGAGGEREAQPAMPPEVRGADGNVLTLRLMDAGLL